MAGIKAAYVRHYRDNMQTTAYVEWADGSRTEGAAQTVGEPCPCCGRPLRCDIKVGEHAFHVGAQMAHHLRRAENEGHTIEYQVW